MTIQGFEVLCNKESIDQTAKHLKYFISCNCSVLVLLMIGGKVLFSVFSCMNGSLKVAITCVCSSISPMQTSLLVRVLWRNRDDRVCVYTGVNEEIIKLAYNDIIRTVLRNSWSFSSWGWVNPTVAAPHWREWKPNSCSIPLGFTSSSNVAPKPQGFPESHWHLVNTREVWKHGFQKELSIE